MKKGGHLERLVEKFNMRNEDDLYSLIGVEKSPPNRLPRPYLPC